MQVTTTKRDAAFALLNRAFDVYLDHHDCLSAIVLAGSAEDLMQGLLTQQGQSQYAARRQLLAGAREIAQAIDPEHAPISEKDTFGLMRGMFNWLRHSDKKDEPDSVTWDLDREAETIIYRALQNWDTLKGLEPPRATEFVNAKLAIQQRNQLST